MDTLQAVNEAETADALSKDASQNIRTWLSGPKYAEYVPNIESLVAAKDWKTLEDSFFKVVPFGTGGRRGTVGIGPNRINRVTLGESAQGFINYIVETVGEGAKKQGIVIAHDTRTTSREFAEYVATICAANNFKTYLFDSFRATPELSFAVRHLQAAAGVVISASHNPPADNGFKAYWSDGGQIVPPHDTGIMAQVEKVEAIATTGLAAAQAAGFITIVGKDIDDAYIQAVVNESLVPTRSATIVYSPLHGAGISSVRHVLEKAGFALTLVEEQSSPDGRFPNAPNNIPNPEVASANDAARTLAEERKADIAVTTDPDADRLGVIAPDSNGTYQLLTGNQIACLIGYFVMEQLKAANKISPQLFMAKTIVTTDMLNAIAKDFGIGIYNDILVGFKFVAELIRLHQDQGDGQFIFGGEESYGILKGAYTRDKDAAVAALLIAEQASLLKDQGKNLVWQLHELYRKYGLYWETLRNIMYGGAEGFQKMNSIMTGLRTRPPQEIMGHPVVKMVDRLSHPTQPGDVLVLHLSADGQNRLTVRPSGTEPKLKIYTQIHKDLPRDISDEALNEEKVQAEKKAQQFTDDLIKYFESV